MADNLPKMDETLRAIFLDAYTFLRARQIPDTSEAYWDKAANDMSEQCLKWDAHPLATELYMAVYNYLSGECKRREAKRKAEAMR